MRDTIEQFLAAEPYDYLIMDCPPSLGVLTINALSAAEEVFIPLQPHFLALHGLSKLLETTALVTRRLNRKLRVSGIVLCMHESNTRLAADVAADLSEFLSASDAEAPWVAGPHLRQQDPPQHQAGRGPQPRQVDLRLRSEVPRRRRLPGPGERSHGDGASRRRAVSLARAG